MHSDLTHEKAKIEQHLEALRHHPQGRRDIQQLHEMLKWQKESINRMLERLDNGD